MAMGNVQRRHIVSLLLAIPVLGSLAGCGPRVVKPVYVTYREFGDEFLPYAIELFERNDKEPLACEMVWVLFAIEARIPTEEDETSYAVVLLAAQGKKVSDSAEQWKLMLLERYLENGERRWRYSFRINPLDADDNFSGSKSFDRKPSLAELETYATRAKLPKKYNYFAIKLSEPLDTSRRYYVRGRTYDQELKELYGQVPGFLKELNQELFAEDAVANKKKAAE